MLARFKLCKEVPMSIPNVNNSDVPSVNPTDGTKNEELLKQYQEQYQQFLSQYQDASAAWSNIASDIKTGAGESVRLAINNQLNEAQKKLDAFQAAINTSEPSEETLKAMAEELETSIGNVTAYIAAIPTSVADTANIKALRETWEELSADDKVLLGSEFKQAIDAKFDAFNDKIAELQQAIKDGADASNIKELQDEISELKKQLNTLVNGKTDGSVMPLTDRIDCLKTLEKSKKYLGDEVYATFKQQLLSTDASKQISKEDFQTQLDAIVFPAVQKEVQESVETTETVSKHAASVNELLKNNIALKVMQEKNSFLEFKLNAEADAKLQEKAEFNPQVKQLRDEGQWQTPDVTRQQEVTQMLNEDERRREKIAQMR